MTKYTFKNTFRYTFKKSMTKYTIYKITNSVR